MDITFSGKLPPIYKRNGRECYLDSIRKNYARRNSTAERDPVFDGYTAFPMQEIISEQHLSHYGITSKKREDIVIYALDADQQSVPIAVIECKAPNVYLDMKAKEPWENCGRKTGER